VQEVPISHLINWQQEKQEKQEKTCARGADQSFD